MDGDPGRVHSPEVAVIALDVGDIGVAVGENDPVLSLGLLLEQFEEMGETDLGTVSQLSHNRGVQRGLLQAMNGDGDVSDVFLDIVEEQLLEVVTRPSDVGVLEMVFGDELLGAADRHAGNLAEHLGRRTETRKELLESLRIVNPTLHDVGRHLWEVLGDTGDQLGDLLGHGGFSFL